MKLGCAVSTYETKFGPIVFKDGNIQENARLLEKYGYESVDLFIKDCGDDQLREYRELFAARGIGITTLFAIYLGENGVTLAERDPQLRRRNVDMVKRQLEKANILQAKGLGMGFVRGMHEANETEEDALKRIAEALGEIGEYAQSIGSCVLLEPINRYEVNTLNSAVKTADFVRENRLDGVVLQPDMFHMNIEDGPIPKVLRYVHPLIGNIHISSSNRYAVGNGHFDFVPVLQTLQELDYDGPLTFEGFAQDAEQSIRQTAEAMRRFEAQCRA